MLCERVDTLACLKLGALLLCLFVSVQRVDLQSLTMKVIVFVMYICFILPVQPDDMERRK